ncbi:MAG: 16S rRNA (adenine(1518)-N(6)/adenine(1519)-N(6))-dimethyltransferase [Proteobacteria bacterium]|nr:MAG: 16S rRNA (adenine(1518)-N(6)/adenine(1519)-N(6))-dimethyltransferase [Pseudomonadota bacterium]
MPRHQAKKRFGQHFLSDAHIINLLVSHINPMPDDQMLEIGPGLGALTKPILALLNHLQVIEIDRDVINHLKRIGGSKLTIHNVDALRVNLDEITDPSRPLRIIGNLPYNISTPLIFHLLNTAPRISDMHFMLQKEVVDRITAVPGNKDFGRLSVMVQYRCQTEYLFFVGPESFSPPPQVDSAVVKLTPWTEKPFQAVDETLFANVVTQAFSQRRKTLRNTLKKLITADELSSLGIEPTQRAETLSVSQFVAISNHISELSA